MIKINLLPVRAARKKETLNQQIIIFLLSVAAVVAASLVIFFFLQVKISSTNEEIARSESEIQELKTKIGKINDLKKLKDQVKKKLDVLDLLRKGKVGPVNRLMTLSNSTPDKLWLTKYTEKDTDVNLSGIAYNEDLIASFMRNLASSSDFESIELVVAEQSVMNGVKVKKFELKFKLKGPKVEEPAKKK
jgi:type IV pilus assembly protein PilN